MHTVSMLTFQALSTFLKNRNFNSCDHVMLAFEVTDHNVKISINHLQKYCLYKDNSYHESTQNGIERYIIPV